MADAIPLPAATDKTDWVLTGEKLECPKCHGTNRIHRNEMVAIRQEVLIDEKGYYEFTGDNKVFWESSEYYGREAQGEPEWSCRDCGIDFDAPNLLQHRGTGDSGGVQKVEALVRQPRNTSSFSRSR